MQWCVVPLPLGACTPGCVWGRGDDTAPGHVQVFHSGTALNADGQLVAVGGRVLGVTALGKDVAAAQKAAYQVRRLNICCRECCQRTQLAAARRPA